MGIENPTVWEQAQNPNRLVLSRVARSSCTQIDFHGADNDWKNESWLVGDLKKGLKNPTREEKFELSGGWGLGDGCWQIVI